MTIPKPENDDDKYEYKYQYVYPESPDVNILTPDICNTLTPLENAFLFWYIKLGNGEKALDSMIHPAYYFDKNTHGSNKILSRPHIQDILKKFKQGVPYLKLYSAEYMAKLLHDEVENLRHKNRNDRFYGPKSSSYMHMYGKTPHREEMAEVDMLLRCLEILDKLHTAAQNNPDASTTKPGDKISSIDRVLAEAQKLINERQIGPSNQSREDT